MIIETGISNNPPSNVTGTVALGNGGTCANIAADARINLGVDAAGTDNSTNVTLTGSGNYLSISGQAITVDPIDISDDTNLTAGTGLTLSGDTLNVNAAQLTNSVTQPDVLNRVNSVHRVHFHITV